MRKYLKLAAFAAGASLPFIFATISNLRFTLGREIPSANPSSLRFTIDVDRFAPSHAITVAVIDTGIDQYHPDLQGLLWCNEGEIGVDEFGRDKRTNGIDDDKNGFVDDVNGWNFAGENSDIADDHGHGSHVSGIITEGGQLRSVRIMTIKYFDNKFPRANALEASIRGIRYAIQMGAQIINYSGGGPVASERERAVLEEAREHGVLVVAAAGNERTNADVRPFYPASYGLENIISVAAVDGFLRPASFSNWGVNSVDISAPGEKITSTRTGGGRIAMTGTSQATAFVTRVAALYIAQNNGYISPREIVDHIYQTSDAVEELILKSKSGAVINQEKSQMMRGARIAANGMVLDDSNLDLDSADALSPEAQ